MSVHIDRCYCFQRTFAELREVARSTGAESIAELQQHVHFGLRCQLCHPYVHRMLETGEVVFRTILTEEEVKG